MAVEVALQSGSLVSDEAHGKDLEKAYGIIKFGNIIILYYCFPETKGRGKKIAKNWTPSMIFFIMFVCILNPSAHLE